MRAHRRVHTQTHAHRGARAHVNTTLARGTHTGTHSNACTRTDTRRHMNTHTRAHTSTRTHMQGAGVSATFSSASTRRVGPVRQPKAPALRRSNWASSSLTCSGTRSACSGSGTINSRVKPRGGSRQTPPPGASNMTDTRRRPVPPGLGPEEDGWDELLSQGWHSRAESRLKQEHSKELVKSKTASFLAQIKHRERPLIHRSCACLTDNERTCLLLPSLTWKSVRKRKCTAASGMKTHPEVQRARPQQGRCGRWSRGPGPCCSWGGPARPPRTARQEPAPRPRYAANLGSAPFNRAHVRSGCPVPDRSESPHGPGPGIWEQRGGEPGNTSRSHGSTGRLPLRVSVPTAG